MHDVMFINVPKGVDEMIMSPMHEKEGDKFSYTFTVPGTYQYHCHPHEALGMKGTLIVAAPSKPGETVAMNHHKMAKLHDDAMEGGDHASQSGAASDLAQATGKINSIDAEKHTINVTHDPIKALGCMRYSKIHAHTSRIESHQSDEQHPQNYHLCQRHGHRRS